MKCLVTGGEGFIGSHVVSELVKMGFDVVVYDIACDESRNGSVRAKFVQDDIRNFERLSRTIADADYIFHLSGLLGTHELFDTPREAIDVNINGALNILLASRDTGRYQRIFFPTKPNEWNNIYSVTAQAVEKLGHSYRENLGLDVRALRLWNVYGPRQKLLPVRKAVPLFVFQALENRPVEIFGDGTQWIELLYVGDVAKSIVDYMIFDGKVSETFELRTSVRITVEGLARQIIEMTGSQSPVEHFSMRKGEGAMELARARDAKEILGEDTSTPFEDGMRRTIEWYREVRRQAFEEARNFYVHRS